MGDMSHTPGLGTAGLSTLGVVFAATALRAFADGFAAIILPAYLTAIGYDAVAIGLIATVSLAGTALLTLLAGAVASRFDLRNLLIAAACLAVASGLLLPNAEHFAFLALIAFVGTISPASSNVGIHTPIEHTFLAREVSDVERTATFARYSLIGALAGAVGALAASAPDLLVKSGVGQLGAFRIMFYGYAALGVASMLLYLLLPKHPPLAERPTAPLGPSRGTVYKLAALFCVDAFAGGFIVNSLLALWLFERFGLSLSGAAAFFFCASTLSAFSYPVAARLAKRFGLVNTMVFTHIPSSIFLIVAAFADNLYVVLALLLLRSALSQMDVPTRTSYVMAVVTPVERPAAASVTAVPRSLAAAVSPMIAGTLLATPFSGLPLVVCGSLKIAYDLVLLWSFRDVTPPEEGAARKAG
jgi:MFS family permease